VVPGDSHRASVFVMFAMLLVLLGVVGLSARGTLDPLADTKVLRAHYDLLVTRLARLDDLRSAQAVAPEAYRAAREELVGRLAALTVKMRAVDDVRAPASADDATLRRDEPAAPSESGTRGPAKPTHAR
jgi:hypothetical protein